MPVHAASGPPVVVVGAGSAGSVVAARLVDAGRSVLLLEAGPCPAVGDVPEAVRSPNFLAACALPAWTWPDLVARRTPAQAPRPYLRGRGIGGSSAVNAMVGLWGTPEDHRDAPPGWGWDDLARYRAEVDTAVPRLRPARATWSPLEQAVATAALDAGHPWCPDDSRPGAVGVGPARLAMGRNGRVSAADVWLEPRRGDPRLTIRGDTEVARVWFEGRRAVGVVLRNGEEVPASRVVLAAGSIGSPAVLLRSGVDRPGIGQGLADHPSVGVALPLRLDARVGPQDRLVSSLVRYHSGLAARDPADMQVLTLAGSGTTPEQLAVGVIQVAVMASYSRGTVRIDGDGAPVVDFDLLADERDRVRLRDGLRRLQRMLDHPSITAVATAVLADPATGLPLSGLDLDDDVALDRWLDEHSGDYVHAACTARMGPLEDPDAVVSPVDGAVWGHDGLHVIDASVLHRLPRANTHLPTTAAAARLADGLIAGLTER